MTILIVSRGRAIFAFLTRGLFLILFQMPQTANAQDYMSAAPIAIISSQAVSAARRAITANGTRPGAENSLVHILPTLTAGSTLPTTVRNRTNFYGFKLSQQPISSVLTTPVPGIPIRPNDVRGVLSRAVPAFPSAPPGEWNPATLAIAGGDPDGNKTGLVSAKQVNVYINCPVMNDGCWGNNTGSITAFEANLAKSTFITITDQYVGSKTKDRYPLGLQLALVEPITNKAPWGTQTLLDSDAQAIAYQAASGANSFGYGFVYHLFVPQGTDVCFDDSYSVCYSPDNNNTFVFCGYHASFDLGGHHILYTVEPYAPVAGCYIPPMSNTDAQVNVLAHEIFETITDPDPNYEWNSNGGLGEIADLCEAEIFTVPISGSRYNIQLMFSNKENACRAAP